MTLNIKYIKELFLVFVGILFLLNGNVLYFEPTVFIVFLQIFLDAILIIFILKYHSLILTKSSLFFMLSIGICIFLASMFRADNIWYAFYKLDSLFFSSFLSAFFFAILIKKSNFLIIVKQIIEVGFIIFLLTVIYKLQLGFWDRGTRFLINGPNVYGWISGLYGLLCYIYYQKLSNNLRYMFFLLCFFFSVFWSQSKGALIGFTSVLFLIFIYKNIKDIKFVFKISFLFSVISIIISILTKYFSDSRVMAVVRIFDQHTEDSDYGSVGIRMEMYNSAFELFKQHPVFGVGLSNFSFLTNYGINYPHNVPLEILAELGIIGALYFIYLYIHFALYLNLRQIYFVIISLYFFIVCLFSGDLGYLRFSLFFLLLGTLIKVNKLDYNFDSDSKAC